MIKRKPTAEHLVNIVSGQNLLIKVSAMSYHHFTAEEREKIFSLKEKLSYTDITDEVGCHKSTISIKLSRNGGLSGYSGVRAQNTGQSIRTLPLG